MGTPTMHRLAALLLALSVLLLLPVPQAQAQEPTVRLTLIGQTPWVSMKKPRVELRVRAENLGDAPIRDLSIGLTLWGPVRSVTAYGESLVADPVGAVAIDVNTLPQEGVLQAGRSRVFDVGMDLGRTAVSRTESLIYPLKIELRSGFTSLVAVRTPVILLVRRPLTPLNLAWTFVLYEPIDFGPDGVFGSSGLEQALKPGGRLAGEIRALLLLTQRAPRTPVDIAVSPALLADLARMRTGYKVVEGGWTRQVKAGVDGSAAAAKALADLKQIAASPRVELTALPFSAPWLPTLAAGGLSRDLATQLEEGRQAVASALDRAPDPAILRPPDSALDRASLADLPGQGVGLLLLDPTTVPPPPQPLGFAPPPTASLAVANGDVTAVVGDPDVQAMLGSNLVTEDPVLGTQAVLGQLAQVWLEQPSVDRGLAITFPEGFDPPGAFFGPLVRGIAGAPWLRKVSATSLAAAFPPADHGQLAPTEPAAFPRTYVDDIKLTRRHIDIYRSMLVGRSDEPARLDTLLLFAESGQFVGDQATGSWFIRYARDAVGSVFDGVRPDTGQVITLTSSSGKGIPVRITNRNPEPLRVTVSLVSPHLRETPQSSMILDARTTETVSFDVQLTTTGRFPVVVQVASPSGRVISQGTLIVRSTAYNRIALIITIGAAALALLVWARRFLPRRTS